MASITLDMSMHYEAIREYTGMYRAGKYLLIIQPTNPYTETIFSGLSHPQIFFYDNVLDCALSNPQPLVIHPLRSLPWLPALLASSFNGVVYHALIATVTLQDTQYTTAEVVAVQ